jgi:hypothetical protein
MNGRGENDDQIRSGDDRRRYSRRMHARWLPALAMLAILALPVRAGAQARGPVGTSSSGHAHPGSPSPGPTVRRPSPTAGIVAPFRGVGAHRPMLVRSSVFGLVVFDPYWWLDPGVNVVSVDSVAPPAAMPGPGPILSGGLQLDVEPRRALVYVDGLLAGTVDQFKGYFRHLETRAGFHVITFLAPGYDPLTIEVTVAPNKTDTYRGFLNRR